MKLLKNPLIKILASMEIKGIKIDKNFFQFLSDKFESKIKELEKNF